MGGQYAPESTVFSSIDIIDGQHRLYGYVNSNVSQDVRDNAEILVSAIKFRLENGINITKNAARVFVEINANQAKVKKDLIYLIKYDVLGETDHTALAGKIMLECDRRSGPLQDMLLTSTLKKKNKLNLNSVPITTIVDNDLEAFLKGFGTESYVASDDDFERVFDHSKQYYLSRPADFIRKNVSILNRYFIMIKDTFPYDWEENAKTYLISSKYFSAFIRLLRFHLFNEASVILDMENVLQELKTNVDEITNPNNSPTFVKGNQTIPSTKHGIKTIFDFFVNTESFDPE